MKSRVVALASALVAAMPWGPAGCCAFPTHRPLSRTHPRHGPIQLDAPRKRTVAPDTPVPSRAS